MKSKMSLCALVSILFVAFSSATTAWSQAAGESYRLLDKATYLEMETVSRPQISPDGRHVVFVRGWVDKMNDRARSNLWIVDIDGRRLRELTHGNWSDSSPVWSPDGTRIAFLSNRDGTTQIHVLWLDTREVKQLTHVEQNPVGLRWSPDGRTLAFGMFLPDRKPILPVELPEFPRGAKLAEPATVIDRIIWAYDGMGSLPKGHMHLFTLDAETGGTPRQVSSGDYTFNDPRRFRACDPQWARDGRKLYFAALLKPWDEVEMEINECEVHSLDLLSGRVEQLTNRKGPDRGMRISPDGKWIAYTGFDDQNYADGNISSLYLMDINGGTKSLLAGELPSSPRGVTWAPDSSGVYYLMAERGVSNLHFVSRRGEVKRITSGNHYLSEFTLSENGRVAAVLSSFHKPGYLVTFHVNEPEVMETLVDVNADVLADVKLGEVEEMWFKSPDGLDLQGWLIKPSELEPGRQSAAVALDPWRPLCDVLGPVELGLAELRRHGIRGALHESAGEHRIWKGLCRRDQTYLSGQGFRRPDGRCR